MKSLNTSIRETTEKMTRKSIKENAGKPGKSVDEMTVKRLKAYAAENLVRPDESKIEETLRAARRCFYEGAEGRTSSFWEFIYEQMGYIRKRWWILQFLALFFASWTLHGNKEPELVQRLLGVSASIFAVMVIPELWKNRSHHSMEIEGASYFSIRQIYAARMMAFMVVDCFFLSIFTCIVSLTTAVSIAEMIVQFFLPMTVTCCICFRTLCSRIHASEYMACFLSLVWTAVWTLLILDDRVYLMISIPVWVGICCAAVLYLTYAVRKVLRECAHESEICDFSL